MSSQERETISVEIDTALLAQLRQHARNQGRELRDIINEALRTYASAHAAEKTLLDHLEDSMDQHDKLGRLLAQ